MSSSLEIRHEMIAFDKKDRQYYDNFTDEDRKKFSTYLMLRYGASVTGSSDMQAYYLLSTNERVNKYFFDLNKHPKLQWLLCTTVSPGLGTQNHVWFASKKKDSGKNKIVKFLTDLYPAMKRDEILLLASLNDNASIKELAIQNGMTDKDIKELLK